MGTRILTYAAILILLLGEIVLSAQNVQDLDAALDYYEDICNQCFDLRARMRSGEQIAAEAVTPLLERLTGLRERLGSSKGEMSFEQLRRFESIRERYARAFNPTLLPGTSVPVSDDVAASLDPARGPSVPTSPESIVDSGFHSPWYVGILAFAGFPFFAPGLMLTADTPHWGLYAKGYVGVRWVSPAYSGLSDGTSEQGTLWTTGKERRSRFGISAGGSWFPLKYLGIYAGAGYGQEKIYWEDTNHEWVAITDLTRRGIQADAGLLFRWRWLTAFAGVTTVTFRTIRVETGLGVRF